MAERRLTVFMGAPSRCDPIGFRSWEDERQPTVMVVRRHR
jgi:hypothetical protein